MSAFGGEMKTIRLRAMDVLSMLGLGLLASCGGSSSSEDTPTSAMQWSEAVTVQRASGISGPALAAMAADGTATLLWNRYIGPGGVYTPTAARSRNTVAWTDPVELDREPATQQSVVLALPQTAATPLAVWSRLDLQSSGVLRAAPFGASWEAPESLPTNTTPAEEAFTGSAKGEFFGIWREYDDVLFTLVAARRTAAGLWLRTTALAITSLPSVEAQPAIAADDAGNAMALWVEGSPARIYAARLPVDQRDWSGAIVIDAGQAPAQWPRIVSVGGGQFAATWEQTDNGRRSLHAAHFDGSRWSAPAPLDSGNADGAGGARLASNGQGQAMAVWARNEGVSFSFWSATFDAAGWREPLRLVAPSLEYLRSSPTAAVDRMGDQFVAWTALRGDRSTVEYVHRPKGGDGWTAPVRLWEGAMQPAEPSFAMNGDGQAVVAWVGIAPDNTPSLQARIGRRR